MAKNKKEETEVKETVETVNVDNTEVTSMDELTPEQLAQARVEMRKAIRERFDKWMEVSDEDATDADIEAAREEFEKKAGEWREKQWELADAEKALETITFLQKWNECYNHWEKGAWRGVIAFDEIAKAEMAKQNAEKNPLMIDYQTLVFLHTSMGNPSGRGLTSALAMCELENFDLKENKPKNEETVTYSSILKTIFNYVNTLQIADKMLNLYRERVTMAAAGLKTKFKITELEEFKELHDAWVVTGQDGQA